MRGKKGPGRISADELRELNENIKRNRERIARAYQIPSEYFESKPKRERWTLRGWVNLWRLRAAIRLAKIGVWLFQKANELRRQIKARRDNDK